MRSDSENAVTHHVRAGLAMRKYISKYGVSKRKVCAVDTQKGAVAIPSITANGTLDVTVHA